MGWVLTWVISPDVAEARVLAPGLDHAPVYAADAHGPAAGGLDEVDEALADLAGEHHLRYLGRLAVRDAQAVHESALHAHLVHDLADVRPAAVDEHHAHADELQKDDVLHHLGLELLVLHGVAAVLYDDDAVIVLLDIGQGLHQHLRPVGFLSDDSVHSSSPFKCGSRRLSSRIRR